MATKRYMMYESLSVIGDTTFYNFRVVMMDDATMTLYFLLGPAAPSVLELLDVPVMVPSVISEGQTFSVYNGSGTWDAPEDAYFVYVKTQPFVPGYKPALPDSEDVILSQALTDRPQIVYASDPAAEISAWPTGDDPEDKTVDEAGWTFPLPATFGYVRHFDIAGRVLDPWYYTDVWIEKLWIWSGCDIGEDDDHFLHADNRGSPDSVQNNTAFRWNEPLFIYSCNEESGPFGYLVERETIGDVESISIWLYQSTDPAYHYPHLVSLEPGFPLGLIPHMMALPLLAGQFMINSFFSAPVRTLLLSTRVAKVYNFMPFGVNGEPHGIIDEPHGVKSDV